MMIGTTIDFAMDRKLVICGLIAVATMLAVSCSAEKMIDESGGEPVVFTACWADGQDTRTVLQGDGTSVWWSPKEKISVFFGGYASTYTQTQFTSTNTSPAKTVNFEGYLPILIGSQEAEQNVPVHWAVYPYDATNACDGASVTLTVSPDQEGVENTFAERSFPSIASRQH